MLSNRRCGIIFPELLGQCEKPKNHTELDLELLASGILVHHPFIVHLAVFCKGCKRQALPEDTVTSNQEPKASHRVEG